MMKNIMAAVARMLAAVLLVLVEWSEALGRFIERCRPGHVAPDPQQLISEYVDAVEAAPIKPELDQRLANIQLAAEALFTGQDVTPDMLKGMSPKTVEWLEVLDSYMLIAVAKSKLSDLAEHLAHKKQIRGLLRFEDDAIAEYRRSVEGNAMAPKGPDTAPEKTIAPAWHLPAFGPIC